MVLNLQAVPGPYPNLGYHIARKYVIATTAYAKLLTKVLPSSIFERKTAILLQILIEKGKPCESAGSKADT